MAPAPPAAAGIGPVLLTHTAAGLTVSLALDARAWTTSSGDTPGPGRCTLELALLPALGEAVERMHLLARADAPGATRMHVEHLSDPRLGHSLRVLRLERRPGPLGLPSGSLHQVWRLDDGVDLLLRVSAPTSAALLSVAPQVRDAVRTLRVRHAAPVSALSAPAAAAPSSAA